MAAYVQIGMDEALRIHEQGDEKKWNDFLDKFKPKKTTDDCYTPENVYDAVADWVAREYGLDRESFVRPFYPGESYQDREYPEGCVVVDNPPFSILAEIVGWYGKKGIRFFLFGPGLTIFSARQVDVSYVCVGADIRYANGAQVCTSFVTNLDTCRARTAPDLYRAIEKANEENNPAKHVPKYTFPDCVITAAILQRWCKYGIEYRLEKQDCMRISALDSMKEAGKSIFGGGYLLSEKAERERAEAERAALAAGGGGCNGWSVSEKNELRLAWGISERERMLMQRLGQKGGDDDAKGGRASDQPEL